MSQQTNKNTAAMAAVDANELDDPIASAVDRDFGPGAMAAARAQLGGVVRTPFGQKVANRIAEKDESPHGQMKLMIDEARVQLAELDDKRIKLESLREVQIEVAEATAASRRALAQASIAELEKRIATTLADIVQGDEDAKARVIKINADVDLQVDAIDQMEAWHRNVIETGARNITPARKGKVKKDSDIPY